MSISEINEKLGEHPDIVSGNIISKKDDIIEVLEAENPFLSAIENRLAQSNNKKVIERVNLYIEIFKKCASPQIAEMDIMDKQVDILNLIDGEVDENMIERYQGRTKEDFQELYTILYGEE